MYLITLAHLGEARNLIKDFDLTRESQHLFRGPDFCCLITGEGPFEGAVKTSGILGTEKFQKVINIGVCGSLDHLLEVGGIYPVRTCYMAIDGKPQFRSFQTGQLGMDLITNFERVLSKEKAVLLEGIGQLVDREAWGVAMAAKEHNVPFECFKIISDHTENSICQQVIENAHVFAEKISHFLKANISKTIPEKQVSQLGEEFHFTFSQKKTFENLLQKISLRDGLTESEVLKGLDLVELRSQKISSKDRTRILISSMELRLDPFKGELDRRLRDWKSGALLLGIELQTDPSWESKKVKISFEVSCEHELHRQLDSIQKIDLRTFHHLRLGRLNVE